MNKRLFLALAAFFILTSTCLSAAGVKNLKGQKFDYVSPDSYFKNPFVDIDKTIEVPVKCRYIHGGFDDGTRFSFYFPLKKEDFTGRFFQYITPLPDSETSAQHYYAASPIGFSIAHGAYFIETNEGGAFNPGDTSKDSSIGAYRANAACAEFSRYIAKLLYDCQRPYGYCFGGSGGAYRTTGGMEATEGVWDGSVPFVLGSPQAIPNVFGVRMYALRILRDKMDDIIDAMRPGGSGDPYTTLNTEERQVLKEATGMGFPIKSWYGWKHMDAHGFTVLYRSLIGMDLSYFREDFWNKPGYLGYDNPPSLQRDHLQEKAVVKRAVGQSEAERLGLVAPISEADKGSADRAWASLGTGFKEKPVAFEIDHPVEMHTLGGEMMLLSGKGEGQQLQLSGTKGAFVILASVNAPELLASVSEGDRVQIDNSDWLAFETYYRHQVPTRDFYVWDQFRSFNGIPVYPQRPMLIGPIITTSASGILPTGKIHGKMILCCSVWDREAFPWQGDWYRTKVTEHLGESTDESFRLWYTDRSTHGGEDDPTEVVDYTTVLYQALLDVSDWVERGIAPSRSSDYRIEEAQVLLSEDGSTRGGVQPSVKVTVGGSEKAEIKTGQIVRMHVNIDVPKGTGTVVSAKWCMDGSGIFSKEVDLSSGVFSKDGEHLEFDTEVSFSEAGTYFPTVKVFSERHGDAQTPYTCIPNLGKMRVVVSE